MHGSGSHVITNGGRWRSWTGQGCCDWWNRNDRSALGGVPAEAQGQGGKSDCSREEKSGGMLGFT